MFEMIVDGKSEKIVNTKPISYKNVKVWAASTGEIYPNANARIRNLKFNDSEQYLISALKLILFIFLCRIHSGAMPPWMDWI